MTQLNYNFMQKIIKFWLCKVTLTEKDLNSDSDCHVIAKFDI